MNSTSRASWLRGKRTVTAVALSLSVGLSSMVLGLSASPSSAQPTAAPLPAPVLKSPAVKKSSAFAQELEAKYIDPDRIYSTDVRWWLGDASLTDESLLEEVQHLYDGGFRGVELCMQNDAAAADADYAYGSEQWTHKWNLLMNKLLDLGMSVYLTSGTNWATSNVPGLDPTSQAAMQNLTLGTATYAPGQTVTMLPAPAAGSRRAGAKLVSAYAYRVTSGNTVDPNSYVDLKPMLTQGADVWTQDVSWTVPAAGSYRVFGTWTQGTFQTSTPSAQPSYATNYFDKRGVEALKGFWETHYLADPALRAKIAQGDVQLFMDSLEINTGGGFTWWAEDMATEFKRRKGYDITPYLFLIDGVASTEYKFNAYHRVANIGTYRLEGAEHRRQGIVNDYQDVLTQLYRERMLQPLKQWLNSVGIETRAQISYGRPFEISEPIMDVDYPEAENLNMYNQIDLFRLFTGGAKLENKVLSSETGAAIAPYNATHQRRLRDAYSQFAAGMQRTVWHVWGSDYGYGSYQWPGWVAGNYNYLGNRNPGARDYDELNAHLGRVQQLMQTGESRTDVGFIHQTWSQGTDRGGLGNDNTNMNWQFAHQGIQYRSTELQDNGYTYDYFSPRFLFDDDVRFDPQTRTIEKAGYKALVLYQEWLDLEASQRILRWAKQGLPVVLLEDAASRTPYNDGKGGALRKVIDELKTLPTVRRATVYDDIDYFSSTPGGYEDNVMEKLRELGVEPYTAYAEENHQLLAQTRQDADGNRFVYVYNYCPDDYHFNSHKASVRAESHGRSIATDIEVEGQFVPYSIDPWTGEVTELADYRWEDGRTIVPIGLDYGNISMLAFKKINPGEGQQQLRVVDTNADAAIATADGIALRTTGSGVVTGDLSNGARIEQDVQVPAPYDITDWDLTVESWRPNQTAGDLVRTEVVEGLATTNRKTSTVVTDIDVELDKLTTWDKIPEVGKAVSGEGYYEATFDWDAGSASGAYLDFGDQLEESMEVWVNGQKVGGEVSTNPTKVRKDVGGVGKPTIDDGRGNQVPLVGTDLYTGGINWTKPVADISSLLVDGENSIVIDYSSVLANVQLDRGVIQELRPYKGFRESGWWGNDQVYMSFGPQQAKIVPFVDVEYATRTVPPVPPTTGPPTTVPPTTVPPVTLPPKAAAKVRVKDKVRAGKMLKIRGRDLQVNKVSITLGGKKLGGATVEDGRLVVTRKVPKNLKGRTVLRMLDRKGEVLARTTIRVVNGKAS